MATQIGLAVAARGTPIVLVRSGGMRVAGHGLVNRNVEIASTGYGNRSSTTISVLLVDDLAASVKAGDRIEIDGEQHAILGISGVVSAGVEVTLNGN